MVPRKARISFRRRGLLLAGRPPSVFLNSRLPQCEQNVSFPTCGERQFGHVSIASIRLRGAGWLLWNNSSWDDP